MRICDHFEEDSSENFTFYADIATKRLRCLVVLVILYSPVVEATVGFGQRNHDEAIFCADASSLHD